MSLPNKIQLYLGEAQSHVEAECNASGKSPSDVIRARLVASYELDAMLAHWIENQLPFDHAAMEVQQFLKERLGKDADPQRDRRVTDSM